MDIVEIPSNVGLLAAAVWAWTIEFLPRLAAALLILVAGWFLSHWASSGIRRLSQSTGRIDRTLHTVLATIVRYGILVVVVVAAISQLGIQTTSILAVLGAAGLALGLALQGTLSNLAAGIMLLWLRPFRVGDFIETPAVAGSVEDINLFHCQLRTWDGIFKFVPNAQLWNVILTNYTRNASRLIILEFGIDYSADIAEARRILTETAHRHEAVLRDPPPAVVPLSLGDSAVVLQMRAWAPTPKFWDIRWDLTLEGKRQLEAAGITIPFPQRVIHVARRDSDPLPVLPGEPGGGRPAADG